MDNKISDDAKNAILQLKWAIDSLRGDLNKDGENKLSQISWSLQTLAQNFDTSKWQSIKRDIEHLDSAATQNGRNKLSSTIRFRIQDVDNKLR